MRFVMEKRGDKGIVWELNCMVEQWLRQVRFSIVS